MATTKEAIVLILDVGKYSTEPIGVGSGTFLDKAKECCMRLLQKKMFENRKDEIALITMGTDETDNCRNDDAGGGYWNICQASNLSIPTWDFVRTLKRCESHPEIDANWLDAVDVAVEMLNNELKNKKFANLKIVLFASFRSTGAPGNSDKAHVVENLNKLQIELVVISDNIEFCFPEDVEPSTSRPSQATFTQVPEKSREQVNAEKLILAVIEESDGNLTHFDHLLEHLTNFQKKRLRTWYWYAKLEITKDLEMEIAAAIGVKSETYFKFTTTAKSDDLVLRRVTEHYKNGERVEIDADDTIKGYMVGSTPVAYDETLGIQKYNTTKGLRFLAFTKSSNLSPQFFCSNSTYVVMAKEGNGRSQKLFRLLVKSMIARDFSMIANRIYSNGHKPKLVALTPNLTATIPTLNMYEMVYADQVYHWYFPQLCTQKTQPTAEQYKAVDELIDAMDLMDVGAGGEGSCGEAFPHDKLISPALQHIHDTVTKRVLDPESKVEVFDDRLMQALKVPEKILQRSAEPKRKVKEVFPLAPVKSTKKDLIRKLCLVQPVSDGDLPTVGQNDSMDDVKIVTEVGTINPEEDFKTMLNQDLDAFPKASEQLGNVLYNLIFKTLIDQTEKVCDAMTTYREFAKFYGPYVYSEWIRAIKATVVARKKMDFWENVVVKNRLGIISMSESEQVVSVTDEEAEEFYRTNVVTGAAAGEENEADVDDLFGQM